MPNGWASERRERQSELIQRWNPGEQFAGPRTKRGKAKAAKNSDKWLGWVEHRSLRSALAAQRDALSQSGDLVSGA